MTTVQESGTGVNDEAFIEDNYTRVEDGIITTIENVKAPTSYTTDITVTVSASEVSTKWRYDEGAVAAWNEDESWLVKLANKRGVGLEDLDDLEGEEVYIEPGDGGDFSMYSEHPREMFDESEIEESITVEDRNTLESSSSDDKDIEADCMKYETVGDHFVCEIDGMHEIERDGGCNIIEVTVDTPYDEGCWQFKKPYSWDNSNVLVELAESRNYGNGNFTSLVGDEVLVKRENDEWVLNTANPRESTDTQSVSSDSTNATNSTNITDSPKLTYALALSFGLAIAVLLSLLIITQVLPEATI